MERIVYYFAGRKRLYVMKTTVLFAWLLFTSLMAGAKTPDFDSILSEIAWYADIMVHAEDSKHRLRAHDQLIQAVDSFLMMPGSFDVRLDSIIGFQSLYADNFRIVTWQLRHSPDEYSYGGFIQWPDRVVGLVDNRPFLNGSAYSYYSADKWYGCVYYEIIPFELHGKRYYILMGFHAENSLVNTKVADVLDLTGESPRLGLPVFVGNGEARTRLILTYFDGSLVQLKYDKDLKGIVHHHLITLPGVGPNGEALPVSDGSLEGWIFKKGNWHYEEEVYRAVPVSEPPMLEERKVRKEEKDILGRPRG